MDVEKLEQHLSLTFKNHTLVKEAFTHSSYVNEHQHKNNQLLDNERLEFLGDAVLELTVSHYLFNRYSQLSEGELTKMRASIVCEESFFRFAQLLGLNEFVRLGKGEERMGGRNRQALLADVFEAFIGALYLDQGLASCQTFLEKNIFPHITDDAFSYAMDYKTALQEFVQEQKGSTLTYTIVSERGPSHAKLFEAEVSVNNELKTTGLGKTKKEAEQQAAKKMLDKLRN